MRRTDVAILGAGQAGLAMSRCLAARGIEHVVIERGRIGERWRSEAWDSLHLLTPNWMTRLPGHAYAGPDPHGFMHRSHFVALLEAYARAGDAPVVADTAVRRLAAAPGGYAVETDRGSWHARAAVVATGACDRGALPGWAAALDGVHSLHASAYRRPDALPPGGVLVVGASASGAQLALELRAAGREVTVAVGRHVRLPRRYRGRDIFAWLELAGLLDEPWHTVPDLEAARRAPSMQLSGRGDVGLPALARAGIRLVGRVTGAAGRRLTVAPTLEAEVAAAEERRRRTLARIDAHIARASLAAPADPAAWTPPVVPVSHETGLDLRAEGIGTVLFATGYRRDYSWLDVPVRNADGEIAHDGGITAAPGLYALGLRFMRRRSSSFIGGVGRDAEVLAQHLAGLLGATRLAA